jgi:hypothetical protein
MESRHIESPDDAQAALRQVDRTQQRLATRLAAPWWYRLGAALCTLSLFVGMGLITGRPDADDSAGSAASLIVVVGAVVGPSALLVALRRWSGVSLDRYAEGMGPWYAVVFGLLGVAFVLQAFAGVPFALLGAGALAFVATFVNERRLDDVVRRRVMAGR